MAATDHTRAYRPVAIALHWIVALLVISTIPVGIMMLQEDLPRSTQDALFIYHKNLGVIIFLLVVARIAYRIFNPPPPLPASVPSLQRTIATATHIALYALLLVMTISGYIYVTAGDYPLELFDAIGVPHLVAPNEDLADRAQAIHVTARFPLVLLIIVHIGAALYHAVFRRDGVFTRMAPMLRR